MERKLATIRKISDLIPIKDADMIELAIIDGWQAIVKKGEYNIGDTVIYCEIDSFLPIKPEYEFLRKSSYKRMDDRDGFRIKSMKLRGCLSQGLILPLTVLENQNIDLGEDVSELLDIIKYEAPISACLSGIVRGNFPSELVKTDQERVQNVWDKLPKQINYWISEKVDGSSSTFAMIDNEFIVCSRNMNLRESEDNTYWKIARKYDIENKLRKACLDNRLNGIAIQGEVWGEGIQKNKYKVKDQHFSMFDVFYTDIQEYVSLAEFLNFSVEYDIPTVPIVSKGMELPETLQELLDFADGQSLLNKDTLREGVVIKSVGRYDGRNTHHGRYSFKAISNKFLLKYDE